MHYSSKSTDIYQELTIIANQNNLSVPAAHNSLFKSSDITRDYINQLYINQLGNEIAVKRPADETCRYCEDFHLKHLKKIDKYADISLGKKLEDCFQEFIVKKLKPYGVDIECLRADSEKKNMPDFKIVRKGDQKILMYFEFKAIFRPFLTIEHKINKQYECYSNSLTLDLSNGKKLLTQRQFVEKDLGVDDVFYVYWYDLPCVKGIYWLSSKTVYEIMDIQAPYDRNYTPGDYNNSGEKIGSTNKLYLPLLKMADLGTFIRRIYNWYFNK